MQAACVEHNDIDINKSFLRKKGDLIKQQIWTQLYIYFTDMKFIYIFETFIHSFSSLSYDRSKASSKASSPHSAIQSFLFQMRVSSPFLKVIQ